MMVDLCMQEGRTAAMLASSRGHEEALGLLIAAGADLTVVLETISRFPNWDNNRDKIYGVRVCLYLLSLRHHT